MSDCTNLEMRDLLPDLARGALTGPSLVAVERHLASCASCRAELALVRNAQAVLGATPPVDTSRIAAAVIRSRAVRRRAWTVSAPSRRVWLAAASVVAVAGAALLATIIARTPGSSDLPPIVVEVDDPNAPTPVAPEAPEPAREVTRPAAGAELVMVGGVGDLADADLESLLRELDGLDTQLDVEPATLLPLLEGEV